MQLVSCVLLRVARLTHLLNDEFREFESRSNGQQPFQAVMAGPEPRRGRTVDKRRTGRLGRGRVRVSPGTSDVDQTSFRINHDLEVMTE